tara:strand:+ start:273 stop:455 length:183 start_codon:yes stop_codon:yes gene_type:complete
MHFDGLSLMFIVGGIWIGYELGYRKAVSELIASKDDHGRILQNDARLIAEAKRRKSKSTP